MRLPVPSPGYAVYGPDGPPLPVQVVHIPDHILGLPGRNSTAEYQLVFQVEALPPLGQSLVF